MNFRRSLLHVSYDLTDGPRNGKSMGNEDRCHRSLSHMAVDLLAAPNPIFWLRTVKKNDWPFWIPFGKDGLENPPFSLIFPLKPHLVGCSSSPPLISSFLEPFFSLWGHDRSVSFLVRLCDPGAVFSDLAVTSQFHRQKNHLNQRTPMKHVKHCETLRKKRTSSRNDSLL